MTHSLRVVLLHSWLLFGVDTLNGPVQIDLKALSLASMAGCLMMLFAGFLVTGSIIMIENAVVVMPALGNALK